MIHYRKIPKVLKPNIWLQSTIMQPVPESAPPATPVQSMDQNKKGWNLPVLGLQSCHQNSLVLGLQSCHQIVSHQLYSQHSHMFRVTFLTFCGNFVMIPQDSRIKAVVKSRFLYVDDGLPFWWQENVCCQIPSSPFFCISWKLFKAFCLELYKHWFN